MISSSEQPFADGSDQAASRRLAEAGSRHTLSAAFVVGVFEAGHFVGYSLIGDDGPHMRRFPFDWVNAELKSLADDLDAIKAKQGAYPQTLPAVKDLPAFAKQYELSLADKPDVEQPPTDPWNNAYRYAVRDGKLELHSTGVDGLPGGSGPDADLYLDGRIIDGHRPVTYAQFRRPGK
jgi:hypothetical protein